MAETNADPAVDPVAYKKLRDDLMMHLGGYSVAVAYAACHDTLASVIGQSCSTLAEAEALADAAAQDLKTALRSNWDYLSQMRLHAARGADHG